MASGSLEAGNMEQVGDQVKETLMMMIMMNMSCLKNVGARRR